MNALAQWYYTLHNDVFSRLKYLDGVPLLGIRLYLAYPFWLAGKEKLSAIDNITVWFGPGGLDLPFPEVMAYLAAYTEFIGAWLLVIGLAVRWISIPLMITMLVAIFAVHWDNGWLVVATSSDPEVAVRLQAAREILQEHGNYAWLKEKGNFVILNNGIEFGVTYFLMLFALFFTGGGRFTSVDYFLSRLWPDKS